MVSIIVPVYNVETYLPRCIESILKQSLQNLEVILVDDGSTDCSGRICDAYAAQDERIKVIHQKNSGQVAARNAGIRAASGDYIGFVDSDDWIEKDMYAVLHEIAIRYNADIVMEGMQEEVGNETFISRNTLKEGVYNTSEQLKYIHENILNCEEYFRLGLQPYLWNKLFRKELVKKCMLSMDSSICIGEDALAVFNMLGKANGVVITSGYHYHYCLRSNSVMAQGVSLEYEIESAKACYIALLEAIANKRSEKYTYNVKRFMMNILLTRIYEKYADLREKTILFPFDGIAEDDSVVIYGAGALGKAIWHYVKCTGKIKLKAWIDGNARKYRLMGMPVEDLDNVHINESDKVVVAVFSEKQLEQITEKLLMSGVKEKQVIGLRISSAEEEEMLRRLMSDRLGRGY